MSNFDTYSLFYFDDDGTNNDFEKAAVAVFVLNVFEEDEKADDLDAFSYDDNDTDDDDEGDNSISG